LIPINGVNDMNFSKPKLKMGQEELDAIAAAIKEALR